MSLRVTVSLRDTFNALCFKLKKKKSEYFREWVIREAKKHKVDSKSEYEPAPSDSTLSTAHKFMFLAKPLIPLNPVVGRYKDTNLSCAIAWLHYHVVNAFGSAGHPEKTRIKGIAFQLSTDELNGAKEYLKYFRKYVVPLEREATNTVMFSFAKQLQKRINQLK